MAQALNGQNASMVRINDRGDVIVSVAVPVQRFRAVRGALMLSTQGADIDDMVEAERLAILKVFLVAAAVMVVLSILLAGTIAEPVRRLADAAESVRRRIRSRVEIPDFTRRRDEIGHLSGALRDMTNALYSRIEAIESFAADVAHELKNPLTSLRSAVETLPVAKTDESRARLLDVIQHDVKRLDRLISDISDASRLDAELQRQEAAPVDFAKLLNTLVGVANEVKRDDGVSVTLRFEGAPADTFLVPGHDSRLGQVVDNLIENARSFSPPGGTVRVTCRRLKSEIEIIVDDDGPGVRPDALRKDLRALLHRSAASGLRPEFRTRPVDLQTDRRCPRRRDPGGEPDRAAGCRRRADGRGGALYRAPAGDVTAGLAATVHASAVLVGARAVLIRGPSGSGKSRLALDLIQAGRIGALRFCQAGRRRPRPSRSRRRAIAGASRRGARRPDRSPRRRDVADRT